LDYHRSLLAKVVISGGGAQIPNMRQRIEYQWDLENEMSSNSKIQIRESKTDPSLIILQGMEILMKTLPRDYFITKSEFNESGALRIFSERISKFLMN